ncbi:MAG: Rab family GTPase [Promethearchaeota archaeon]
MTIRDMYKFKICLIGNGGVGKTSLIRRYTQNSFQKQYIKTIGAQFSFHEKEIENDQVRLILWDIAGQDNFNFMRALFFKDSKAAVIVYSLEMNKLGKKSLEDIKIWYDDLLKHCGKLPVAVFANKVDLSYENVVDINTIKKIIGKNNFLGYYVTSAKTGQGVKEGFESIYEQMYYKYRT